GSVILRLPPGIRFRGYSARRARRRFLQRAVSVKRSSRTGSPFWGRSTLEARSVLAPLMDGTDGRERRAPRPVVRPRYARLAPGTLCKRKAPAPRGFSIGAPRFELGTSSPPDWRANQAAPRPASAPRYQGQPRS